MQSPRERFQDIIEKFDMAMLVTTALDGSLHGRPMSIAQIEESGRVWLVTGRHSGKIDEVTSNPEVAITFQNGQRFAALAGRARVVTDAAKVKELWSEPWRVWFPDGPEDTNLVLLDIETSAGEYWDNTGVSGLRYIVDAAKAYFSGTTPAKEQLEEDPAGHGKVTL
ncbi:MAG: pyridoxamine 5'-phosphate oxidase family protein [Myxococcota bacterium]